jgi:adenosylcobinamide-GDP ribazoletransferase
MKGLLGAVQFLTAVPVRAETALPGQAAVWFPLVGAAIGLAAIPLWHLHPLAAVLGWILLTGGLHEDGLADSADAFRAGRPVDRTLAILKDSRIGTFGAIAVVFSICGRWQALDHLAVEPWRAFVASHAVSRGVMVLLAFVTPPAGSGLGRLFSQHLTLTAALLVLAQVIAASLLLHPAALPAALLVVLAARQYFMARIAGVTGDCLGAACQVVETSILWIATR